MSIVLLMGAGFAKAAGSPLADELFDQAPIGGSHERDSQVNLVQSQWYEWQKTHPAEGAEAFITHVYRNSAMIPGAGVIWRALQTYLALRISAAKVAQAGARLDEVVEVVRTNMRRIDLRIAFDTLEYLKRGGRIGTAQAFLGSMLKVNPILTIKDGYTEAVTKTRSRAKAIDHLCNFALSFSRIEEMAVEDAATPDEAELLVERLSAKFPKERIYRSKVSPVVGTHVGPHVLGVTVLGDR